jgi:4'-phosphopantetheinyl transferase
MSDAALRSVSETLSEEERRRGQRFRFPILQRRFAAGRGALRTILGKYLSVDPGRLVFSYNPHGKPSLPDSATDIQFNVSHSHDLMVAAMCRNTIGVDIEKEENRFDTLEMRQDTFANASAASSPNSTERTSQSVLPVVDGERGHRQGNRAGIVA